MEETKNRQINSDFTDLEPFKKILKKIARLRIQDWLLACDEQDIIQLHTPC